MNPERYRRLQAIFDEAAKLEGDDRRNFLDRACADDEKLRRDVERLLSQDETEDRGEFEPVRFAMAVQREVTRAGDEAEKAQALPFHGQIGRYRILEKIAEGGMGVVYLAEQDQPLRRVALKLMRPGALSADLLKRFRFEAELLGRLQHPGIAQIHDAGEAETKAGPQPYFAMEYVDGIELRLYANRQGLGVRARVELLARICDAVNHAHQKGIVHRDLKPGNVLVTRSAATGSKPGTGEFTPLGQPKVLDFGVSRLVEEGQTDSTRLTRTGHVIGTLAYMSPEQAGGERAIDTRSDVYALGVIGFELLTGRLPHELDSLPMVQAMRVVQETPPPRLETLDPELRGDLSIIIGKALELERERRYASAAALAEDLRRFLADQPIAARPPTLSYQLARFVRRNKVLVISSTLALASLVIGLVLALLARKEETRQRLVAERQTAEAQRSTYSARLGAAMAFKISGDRQAARHQLAGANPELRSWEWEYLSSSLVDNLYRRSIDLRRRPVATQTPGEARALFAVEEGSVRLFDFPTCTWTDHSCPGETAQDPQSIALLPGTRSFLRGDSEGRLERVDLDGKIPPRRIGEFEGLVEAIFIAPGGRRAVVVCSPPEREYSPRSLFALDLERFEVFQEFETSSFPYDLAFSPDASRIAVASQAGSILLWELATGERLQSLRGHVGEPISVAFSPSGLLLASGGNDRSIRIWSVRTGTQRQLLGPMQQPPLLLEFHPDEAHLVSAHLDGGIRRWDLETGRCELRTTDREEVRDGENPIKQILFGEREELVYAVGVNGVYVRPLEPPTPDVLRHEMAALTYAYGVDFSPSGRYLASAGWDGTVKLWDVATGRLLSTLEFEGHPFWARYSPDGEHILISTQVEYGKHQLSLWCTTTLRPVAEWTIQTNYPSGLFVPRRDAVVVASGWSQADSPRLEVLDPRSLELREKREIPRAAWSLALSPDGTRLVYGMSDGRFAIRDAESLELLRSVEAHEDGIEAIAFSPDGTRLATGGRGPEIRVWDANTGEPRLRIDTAGGREVFALRFTPDGGRILSGSRHHSVGVWDAETGLEVLGLHGHYHYVHDLALSPDGRILASASGDNTVRLWDARPLKERIEVRRRALDLERTVRADVRRRIGELGSVDAVARMIVEDETLDDDQRIARWNVLQLSRKRTLLAPDAQTGD